MSPSRGVWATIRRRIRIRSGAQPPPAIRRELDARTSRWEGIGLIGTADSSFTVEVGVDGTEVTENYDGDTGTLGIRLESGGGVAVGRSDRV